MFEVLQQDLLDTRTPSLFPGKHAAHITWLCVWHQLFLTAGLPVLAVAQAFEETGTDLAQALTQKDSLARKKAAMSNDVAKALARLSSGLYIVTAATQGAQGAMVGPPCMPLRPDACAPDAFMQSITCESLLDLLRRHPGGALPHALQSNASSDWQEAILWGPGCWMQTRAWGTRQVTELDKQKLRSIMCYVRTCAQVASWVAQASFEPLGLTIAVAKDRAIESLMQARAPQSFVGNFIMSSYTVPGCPKAQPDMT
jgi:hypothetical protein